MFGALPLFARNEKKRSSMVKVEDRQIPIATIVRCLSCQRSYRWEGSSECCLGAAGVQRGLLSSIRTTRRTERARHHERLGRPSRFARRSMADGEGASPSGGSTRATPGAASAAHRVARNWAKMSRASDATPCFIGAASRPGAEAVRKPASGGAQTTAPASPALARDPDAVCVACPRCRLPRRTRRGASRRRRRSLESGGRRERRASRNW